MIREGAALPPRTILFHQPHRWGPSGPGIEPFSAIRRGDWKLIWFHDDLGGAGGGESAENAATARFELFEVARDPSEASERSAAEPEKLAEMKSVMRAEIDTLGAQLPTRRDGRALVGP